MPGHGERFVETFDDWFVRINKRVQRLERRLGRMGQSDSGPVDVALDDTTNFEAWGEGLGPQIRKVGQVVQLTGQVRCVTANYLIGGDRYFMTVPEGYRPAQDVIVRCQGSSTNSWQLRVFAATGQVAGARYGPATTHGTALWMPFHATWLQAPVEAVSA